MIRQNKNAKVQVPELDTAIRDAIRHWSRLQDLADFAARRHGFGNSDGGFGVIYPGDLDDFDRASGTKIPEGFVQVYGFWGPPDGYEVLVSESTYLDVVADFLSADGHLGESLRVRALAEQQRQARPDPVDK